MNSLELKIPPPVLGLLTGTAMWGLSRLGTPQYGPLPLRHVVAPALGAAGVMLALAGAITFRRAKTTLNPHTPGVTTTLVTGGVFRLTRNPMYAGLLFVLLGEAIYLWSPWPLVGPVAYALYIARFQIAPEERFMREKFGAAYDAYAAKVRRWL